MAFSWFGIFFFETGGLTIFGVSESPCTGSLGIGEDRKGT
jgi:hypothetical protein